MIKFVENVAANSENQEKLSSEAAKSLNSATIELGQIQSNINANIDNINELKNI